MPKLNLAIIGAGYWGKNLVRVFYSLRSDVNLKYVCDFDEKKLQNVKNFYPDIEIIKDANKIFADTEVSAVLIATPTSSHYFLAKNALEAGKHVFVEKPMTATSAEAAELVRLARERGLVLMVDHTFLYTGAVRKIKEIAESGELGNLRYLDSERINLGLIQPDTNVIYDLAAHDISIFNYILGESPAAVLALGASYVTRGTKRQTEELAHINLIYPSGLLAHIHVSWLSPVKLRRMLLGGDKKMVLFDDIEPSQKIKIFDQGVDVDFSKETTFDPIYRSGDIIIPKISDKEALAAEAREFLSAIRERRAPLSSGETGLEVVKVLEAATASMRKEGEKIHF